MFLLLQETPIICTKLHTPHCFCRQAEQPAQPSNEVAGMQRRPPLPAEM